MCRGLCLRFSQTQAPAAEPGAILTCKLDAALPPARGADHASPFWLPSRSPVNVRASRPNSMTVLRLEEEW
jgi:hypothetical protein